ncbi:MAG TPA: GNAT family N-acetyltransferase [Streptosporangiaceae bacterium]|nr:GNAT family N-acetyltransferase [Streptosporangiaceae bacterium]
MTDHVLSVYASIKEIDRPDWSAVVNSVNAPAFYDYAFLRAYEQIPLQETENFFYLTFGKPAVAVLPACIQSTGDALGSISGLALPDRLPGDHILLTHVAHCYDTVIPANPGALTPSLADQACRALADLARQSGLKWFAFQNVDGSGVLAKLLTAAQLTKIPMNTRFRRPVATYATVQDYVADIPSKSGRAALRRSHGQARRAGMRVASPDPASGAAEAVELCRRTTARHGTADYYPERLHEFVARAGDLVTVTEVRLGGRLATAAICLSDSMRFHLWAGGIDYEVTTQIDSAFPLMLWPAVEETIMRRRPVFEAGRGNAAAKLRFHLEPLPLFAFVGRP